MELTPFVDQLRRDLLAAAEAGGPELQRAAGLLASAAEPAALLVLLDALATAADELTSAADLVVEVRLRGREVELVAHHAPAADNAPPPGHSPATSPPATGGDDPDDNTARVSLRLPEALKSQAERAAAADGVSLNTWLVRAVATATGRPVRRPGPSSGTRLTGWARS